MPQKTLAIDEILSMLGEGPPRITQATTGLPLKQLHAAPGPGEWSANEVLAHLRSCADVWGDCMMTILEQDRPTIRAVNPRTWIRETDYLEQEFPFSLRAFTKQRTALLGTLQAISLRDWSRAATVTGAGKTLERTVHSYAQWMAEHERPHLKQIERIASALHG